MLRQRVLFVSLILLVASIWVIQAGNLARAEDKGPSVITFEVRKGTVTFPHRMHQEKLHLSCGECHHGKTADGKQKPYYEGMPIQKCSACHNKTMPVRSLSKPYKALHKNCKTCHRKVRKEYPDAPVKCSACHKK